jgi:hypothetical protein
MDVRDFESDEGYKNLSKRESSTAVSVAQKGKKAKSTVKNFSKRPKD